MDYRPLQDPVGNFRFFIDFILCTLIDSVFFVIWLAMQWGVSLALQQLTMTGFDQVVQIVFQVLLAISTLAPIMIWIYMDISKMALQARWTINQTKRSLSPRDDKNYKKQDNEDEEMVEETEEGKEKRRDGSDTA